MQPKWLEQAQQIQAIAQKGLLFNKNPYQIEDYKLLRSIGSEIIATHTKIETSEVLDLLIKDIGYPTPKVGVSSAVFQDNKILLVKQRSDAYWSLPGGFAEVGETPSQVAVRETFEESGYQTRPIKLLSVYDNNNLHHGHPPFPRAVKLVAVYDRNKQGHPPHPNYIYKLFFQCELIGGSASTSIETEDVGFFAKDRIPQLSLGRILPAQITRLFEYHHNPDLPTDFD